ncbi:hypothetical protein QR46_4534 [Giardia duodenalis assemblage B]|uniref:Uncharacterized protein n=1 Tax=Giardia duodenalis assemblage B TaxID=1394984 RepID=A0A132NNC0_GIAIN|nr:hypothetical protein QR46_4534 [Giardia intestinalis assemblage B]
MLVALLVSAVLTCFTGTPFPDEPSHGMGVRFTRRGLEKFCQKGYAIIPDIIAAFPTFPDIPITIGTLKLTLSNLKTPCSACFNDEGLSASNNSVKMEARDGLMQLSMRLTAIITGISGTVDCIFTLKDFGADISLRIGDDPTCPYHFGLFDISNVVYSSGLDIDAIGLDTGGSILANAIQGMAPTLETLVKDTVLQALLDTIFNAIKQSMLDLSLMVQVDDYMTDQRYINGINVIDNKVVANQGGFSIMVNSLDWSLRALYPNKITSPPPRTVYTNRDYELYFDRESVNSYLYVWHTADDKFKASDLTIPYSTIKSQNIPGLADALVQAGLLSNTGDSGRGVTLALAVSPSKSAAPHIPWVGAAALPVNLTGTLVVTASKASNSASTTLVSIEGSTLLTSALKIKKFTYGFNNDQVRAYVELLGVHDIAVTKNDNGDTSYTVPLLAYMVSEKYLPFVNPILAEPGICLMNGNFINITTANAVNLSEEDKVLFVADIEDNQYFA